MYRSGLAFVFALLLSLTACTDWDVGVNGKVAVSNDPRKGDDVDHTGLVWWETQGTVGADAASTDDTAGEDATAGTDDLLAVEIVGNDASGDDATTTDGSDLDVSPDADVSDATKDALQAPDGVLDPCTGANRPIGCGCVNSLECASGLCVFGASGLVCSPSCKNVVCPEGWECSSPTLVCKQTAVAATDAGSAADASGGDDVSAVDAVADAAGEDAATTDVAVSDVDWTDGVADTAGSDGAIDDTVLTDATVGDAPDWDTAQDAVNDAIADVLPFDVNVTDAVSDTSDDVNDANADIDTDGLTGLDWQGYPDASFPDDADIYGGAINSCLSLYLYQQETCGKNNPTAACIDDVAKQGSLYANYLFEPVRACQDALCVDLCAAATDETCMNQCIGKNCPNQVLSCVSNDQHGTADCQTTFSCSMGYPGKLLTIGAKCYANGTLDAQLQVGGLISCETKPNTDSCFQAIGNCYDQGAAATNTCMQTITCTQNCANNQECVWQCLGKANPAARVAVDALGDCMVTVCGPKCNGDQTCQNACIGTDCASQFGNCTAN